MNFPNDETGHVLADMLEAGIDLTQSHKVVFFQLFEKESDAKQMAKYLEDTGIAFDVKVHPDTAPNVWDLDCAVTMVPSYENIVEEEKKFEQIADKFNGYNDGWGIEA